MKKIFLSTLITSITLFSYSQSLKWVNTLKGDFNYDYSFRPLNASDSLVLVGLDNFFGDLGTHGKDTIGYVFRKNGTLKKEQTISPGNCLNFPKFGGGNIRAICKNRNNGTTFICGTFAGNVDFHEGAADTISLCSTGSTAYIAKLNSAYFAEWAYRYPLQSSNSLSVNDLATDEAGALYIGGKFSADGNTFDLDLTPSSDIIPCLSTTSEMFVSKYSGAGAYLWSVYALSENPLNTGSLISKVVTDKNGNIYAGGSFLNKLILYTKGGRVDTLLDQADTYDAFVIKLDKDGNLIKILQLQDDGLGVLDGMTIDESGNLYINTQVLDTFSIKAPGNIVINHFTSGVHELIIKLNSNLEALWLSEIRPYLGSLYVFNLAWIEPDALAVVGGFDNQIEIQPGQGNTYLQTVSPVNGDGYVIIYNASNGSLRCSFVVGGQKSNDIVYGVSSGEKNTFCITGYYSDTTDFDPGPGKITRTTEQSKGIVIYLAMYDLTGCSPGTSVNEEFIQANDHSIYPNPTSGFIYVDNADELSDVHLLSVDGKELLKIHYEFADKPQLDLTHLPSGLYFLKLVNKEGAQSLKKLIKQ